MKKKERLEAIEQRLEVPADQQEMHRLYQLFVEAFNSGDRPEQVRLRQEAEVYFEMDKNLLHFAPDWADWNLWLRSVKTAWGQ